MASAQSSCRIGDIVPTHEPRQHCLAAQAQRARASLALTADNDLWSFRNCARLPASSHPGIALALEIEWGRRRFGGHDRPFLGFVALTNCRPNSGIDIVLQFPQFFHRQQIKLVIVHVSHPEAVSDWLQTIMPLPASQLSRNPEPILVEHPSYAP